MHLVNQHRVKTIQLVYQVAQKRRCALAKQAEREDDAEREEHHDPAAVVADQQLRRRGRQPPQSALAHVCQQRKIADHCPKQEQDQGHLRHHLQKQKSMHLSAICAVHAHR